MERPNSELKINLNEVIASKSRTLAKYTPEFVINRIKKIIHQDELNEILDFSGCTQGVDFADKVLEYLNVRGNARFLDKAALDPSKRYIFVSNHPLGGLDGLLLISLLGHLMGGIRFVVNDLLMNIKPLEPIFVPVNKVGKMGRRYGQLIQEAYRSEDQILYFPAGLCSRLIKGRITDLEWKKNFIKQARRYGRDIVPIHFSGRNSRFFYRLANMRKALGIKFNIEMIFLPDEMFRQKNSTFEVIIGKPIPIASLDQGKSPDEICLEIREQSYNLK